jgi:hypothetical protein
MSFGEIAPKANGGFRPVIDNSNTSQAVGATTGLNAIAIGPGSQAFGQDCIAIGVKARAITNGIDSSYVSIAIGPNCRAGTANFGGIGIGSGVNDTGGFDIIIGNGSSCSGAFGTVIGHNASAVGNGTVIGYGSSASGASAISIGYSQASAGIGQITIGNNNSSPSSAGAITLGSYSRCDFSGEFAVATGCFAAAGDAKISMFPMWTTTTDATVTEFKTGAAAVSTPSPIGNIVLINDTMNMFDVDIIGRNTGDDTQCACWNVKFGIRRGAAAANTALVGTPVKTVFGQDTGTETWDVTVTADTTNGRPAIKVTGEAAKTIRWVANVRMTKVLG